MPGLPEPSDLSCLPQGLTAKPQVSPRCLLEATRARTPVRPVLSPKLGFYHLPQPGSPNPPRDTRLFPEAAHSSFLRVTKGPQQQCDRAPRGAQGEPEATVRVPD